MTIAFGETNGVCFFIKTFLLPGELTSGLKDLKEVGMPPQAKKASPPDSDLCEREVDQFAFCLSSKILPSEAEQIAATRWDVAV